MQIWNDRYLISLGILGLMLSSGLGYQLGSQSYQAPKLQTSLRNTQLPSTLPPLQHAARRDLLMPVDLRLADFQLDTPPDLALQSHPLMDKVLYVPKTFG